MSDDGNFISRWSRRKIDARSGKPLETEATPEQPVVPAQAGTPPEPEASAPLPPIESLTPESDFTPFMKADVDPGARREAMKVLMRDPRFNVMDGLDVYIDDYSKPDPLPPEWLGQLNMMKRLGAFLEEPEAPEKIETEAAESLQKPMHDQLIEGGAPDAASDTGGEKSATPE